MSAAFRRWRRDRRWKRTNPPQEVWVDLLDPDGNVVATSPGVLQPGPDGVMVNGGSIHFVNVPGTTIAALGVVGVDGVRRTIPLP